MHGVGSLQDEGRHADVQHALSSVQIVLCLLIIYLQLLRRAREDQGNDTLLLF